MQRGERPIRFACIVQGSFEDVEEISGRFVTDTILVDRSSCYACLVHCKRVVKVKVDGLVVFKPGALHENPRLQPQRLKHRRAFAFSAYGRKFKPPASRVVVDSVSHRN